MIKILPLLLLPCLAFADATQSTNIPVTANTVVDARNLSTSTGIDPSKAVGMAVAPGLSSSFNDVCLGSTSMGAGFSGGSIALGTTWEDPDCIRRLNAREIRNMGDAQVAKEIMCGNADVRAAFKRVGRPCIEDAAQIQVSQQTISNQSKQRQDELYKIAVEKQRGGL
jgi:hypothetical protein